MREKQVTNVRPF